MNKVLERWEIGIVMSVWHCYHSCSLLWWWTIGGGGEWWASKTNLCLILNYLLINKLSITWEDLNWSLHAGKYSIVWGRNIKLISQNRTSSVPTRKSFSQVRVQHLTLNYHSEIIFAGEKVAIFDSDHWSNGQPWQIIKEVEKFNISCWFSIFVRLILKAII